MSLNEHTLNDREKLIRKLSKQGIESISLMPYERYLRSTLWKSIREWVIEQQEGLCASCYHKAAEVHHHDYDEETMRGERSDGLVGLCARCHGLIEFDDSRCKRQDLGEKRAVFERLTDGYRRFQADGFSLRIKEDGLKTIVEYAGPAEHLHFLDCAAIAFEFVVSVPYSELAFPLPLGREKLAQKTGIRLSLRDTGKHVASVWADRLSIAMHRKKTCPIPLVSRLHAFLVDRRFVKLVM